MNEKIKKFDSWFMANTEQLLMLLMLILILVLTYSVYQHKQAYFALCDGYCEKVAPDAQGVSPSGMDCKCVAARPVSWANIGNGMQTNAIPS